MSSIAYVTDENMLEYHRLHGNRDIIFWRLSSQKQFSDFNKGDLLFFYTRSGRAKRKGFVGYAHYHSTKKLSLKEMWKRYGKSNGYDSKQQLTEAIQKAARDGQVPELMNCLYLTDVVFFLSPVYPEEIGIHISPKLESYCYLDQDDSSATAKILNDAKKVGIDLWSSAQTEETEQIFHHDETRHQIAQVSSMIGDTVSSVREDQHARALAKQFVKYSTNFEMIRSSSTDCFAVNEGILTIAMPFVCQAKNRTEKTIELFGRISLYKLYIKKVGLPIEKVRFILIPSEEDTSDIEELLEVYNNA